MIIVSQLSLIGNLAGPPSPLVQRRGNPLAKVAKADDHGRVELGWRGPGLGSSGGQVFASSKRGRSAVSSETCQLCGANNFHEDLQRKNGFPVTRRRDGLIGSIASL